MSKTAQEMHEENKLNQSGLEGKEGSESISTPNDYLCPIFQELMEDPVSTADGQSYERKAIEEWFKTGRITSPLTGERLPNRSLRPNLVLKSVIQEFKKNLPKIQTEKQIYKDLQQAIRLREEFLMSSLDKDGNFLPQNFSKNEAIDPKELEYIQLLEEIKNNKITDLYLNRIKLDVVKTNQLALVLEQNTSIKEICWGGIAFVKEHAGEEFALKEYGVKEFGVKEAELLCFIIEKSSSLETLTLHKNQIGDKEVKALAQSIGKCKNLQTICLSSNKIGDEGAKILAQVMEKNTSIRLLNLWGNKIGDDGAKIFAKVIENSKSFEGLNLGGNLISERGGEAFICALEKNTNLKFLDLTYNQISNYDIIRILNRMTAKNNQIYEELEKAKANMAHITPSSPSNYSSSGNNQGAPLTPQFQMIEERKESSEAKQQAQKYNIVCRIS